MIPAFKKFETAIEFESADKREFVSDISKVKSSSLMKQETNIFLKKRKLIEIDENVFDYNHADGTTSQIDVIKGKCSCSIYFDKEIFLHLKAARLVNAII